MAAPELQIKHRCRRARVGAFLVGPFQARGGCNVPPPGFLPLLRKMCDEAGALLVVDEIYTGFGRTGKLFACDHGGVMPDVICLGKALTGGFPLPACVGRADVMDAAWPTSTGEAIHTSTFLGNPVGCAMALAQIAEIERLKLPERAAELGEHLLEKLRTELVDLKFRAEVRGLGLMAGVEVRGPDGQLGTKLALDAIKTALHEGYIFLPEGEHGNVISFTPPLTITKAQLNAAVTALKEALNRA